MDQRFFAAPHGFSQLSTSFIAIACLGIHRTPLLTFPCMACTNIARATQAMSSILCYLAFYHTIHLRRALRGPTHPLLSNMSKNKPRLAELCNCPGARSPPGPLYKQPPRNCISSINKKIVVELQGFEPWTPALQRQCSSQLSYSPLLDVYYRLMSQCN